jgi:DUF4097 and DUF4098 domain-containing protein YvlB
MRSELWKLVLVLAAGFGSAGCIVGDGVLAARDNFEETRPFRPGGTFELENTNGPITIATWDEDRVRIEAERAATTERLLEKIEIDVSGEGDRVRVKTRLPRRWPLGTSGSVSYHVTLPRQARLELETVNGRVEVEGISGEVRASTVNGRVEITRTAGAIEASTVNGSIEVSYDEADADGHHSFSTTNGSVTLYLPADVSGRFEARTVNGSIRTDFPLEVKGRIGKRLEGRLGDGRGSYEIHTVNGSVKIRES